jgi:cytochrome c-type biogenesis protein CcmH
MRLRDLHCEGAKVRRILLTFLGVFVSSWFISGIAFGQAPVVDDQTYHIAKKLNCPTCAGRNLADCPTDTCTQWKNEIKAQLDQGKTAGEVLAYFEARFGPTVLQEPPKQGPTAILWAAPVGAAIVFFGVVGWVLWRMSQRGPMRVAATTGTGHPNTGTSASASAHVDADADPFVSELEREVKDES